MPHYLAKVHVKGVDEQGIKELFDDFIGEFINQRNGRWLVSDGISIWAVHPSQVTPA